MAERVLVSGGSGGIGAALCRRLAAAGLEPVIGWGHGRDRAEALAAETGGLALALDLEDDAAIDAAVAELEAQGVPLRGVVLAASPPPAITPFAAADADEARRQWRVNVEGPRRLLAGLIPRVLRRRKQGVVVAVLSAAMAGPDGKAAGNMPTYVIAKHGLAGVLAAAAADYRWLRVATVSPGFTETPMLAAFDPRYLDMARAARPDGRFTAPDAVAADILAHLVIP